MLQKLKEHSGRLWVKALLTILVLSFAMWGIEGVFRGDPSSRAIAQVGDSKVTQADFQRQYQGALSRLREAAGGRGLNAEELQSLNIAGRVLERLIQETALQGEIQELQLRVTDQVVRERLQAIPAFQNNHHEFDRQVFQRTIRANGVTEGDFIQHLRNVLTHHQIFHTLGMGLKLPKVYQEEIFNALEQKRIFKVLSLNISDISLTETPHEDTLRIFYQTHSDQFQKPEFRVLSILIVDPELQKKHIEVSETELRDAYTQRTEEFSTPEERNVTQYFFASQDQARAAVARFHAEGVGGLEFGYARTPSKLTGVTATSLIASQADALFRTKEGDITEPLDSAFGWIIFYTHKVTPAVPHPFEQVKKQLEDDIMTEKLNERLYDIKIKIEDELAGGASAQEVADTYHLTLKVTPPIHAFGMTQKGDKLLNEEIESVVLENGFALPEGEESPMIDLPNGQALIVRVDQIIPAELPEFSQIEQDVAQAWRAQQKREKARERIVKVMKDLESGKDLDSLRKTYGVSVTETKAVSRSDIENTQEGKVSGYDPQIFRQGFALAKHQGKIIEDETVFLIILPEKIIPVDSKTRQENQQKFSETVAVILQKDIQNTFLTHARQQRQIHINENLLQQQAMLQAEA